LSSPRFEKGTRTSRSISPGRQPQSLHLQDDGLGKT
jgi:hypothetical protein